MSKRQREAAFGDAWGAAFGERAFGDVLRRLYAAISEAEQSGELPPLTLQRLQVEDSPGDRSATHVERGLASWHASAVVEDGWRRLDCGGQGVLAGTDTHANERLEALGAERCPAWRQAWMGTTAECSLHHLLTELAHVRELRRSGVVSFRAFLPESRLYFQQVAWNGRALTLSEDVLTHEASGDACRGVLVAHVPVDSRKRVVLEVLPGGQPMSAAQVQEAVAQAPHQVCAPQARRVARRPDDRRLSTNPARGVALAGSQGAVRAAGTGGAAAVSASRARRREVAAPPPCM